jgi:hypothetical protein
MACSKRRHEPPRATVYRSPRPAPTRPVALSDDALRMVMLAARPVEPEKRSLLLERIAARLDLNGAFTDNDVEASIGSGLAGLIYEPAA